jgi:hypothetical protein
MNRLRSIVIVAVLSFFVWYLMNAAFNALNILGAGLQ